MSFVILIHFILLFIDRNTDKRLLNDYKAMMFIVKLQSYARGMAMRDKIRLRVKGGRPRKHFKSGNNNNGY